MGFRSMEAKGFTIGDTVICLCLVGILVGVVIPRYHVMSREARETALKRGLANIRVSIGLFRILNDRNPKNLNELIEKKVALPSRMGPDPAAGSIFLDDNYLMAQALDAQGHPVDAFGNRYLYDPIRGEVRASTKGFESW